MKLVSVALEVIKNNWYGEKSEVNNYKTVASS